MSATTTDAPTFTASTTAGELRDALTQLARFVPTRSTLPVLSSVLIEAGPDGLTLAATDLDSYLELSVPVTVEPVPGAIAVPCKALKQLISKIDRATHVILRPMPDTTGLAVHTETGPTFSLYGLSEDEWPQTPNVEATAVVEVPAPTFRRWCEHHAAFTSTEESRPILGGVYFERENGTELAIVATNGHRLLWDALETGEPGDISAIVPGAALYRARFLAKMHEKTGEPVRFRFGEHHVRIDAGRFRLYVRNIEGPFPNFRQVVPVDFATFQADATIDAGELRAAVEQVAPVASDQTHRVRFGLNGAGLKLSAGSPDTGEASATVPAYGNRNGTILAGFNAVYLLEILKSFGDGLVRVALQAPERAAVFMPAGETMPKALLMPLRLLDK